MHLNPEQKGLVVKPEEWRWSSSNNFAEVFSRAFRYNLFFRCGMLMVQNQPTTTDGRYSIAYAAVVVLMALAAIAFIMRSAARAAPPAAIAEPAPQVKSAADGILDLFKQKSVVALGDYHVMAQEEFFTYRFKEAWKRGRENLACYNSGQLALEGALHSGEALARRLSFVQPEPWLLARLAELNAESREPFAAREFGGAVNRTVQA